MIFPPDPPPDKIILCGFMGTGKTTVGQLIAAQLGWRFVDTDSVIESRTGKPIRMLFVEEGEAAFRRMESDLCAEIAVPQSAAWHHTVIATGGGIVMNPANRDNLERSGCVICLHAPAAEIVARLADEIAVRPMLAGADPAARIEELLQVRTQAYNALPFHVDTAGRTPADVAAAVIAQWKITRMA